jgi:gas vesicle protein
MVVISLILAFHNIGTFFSVAVGGKLEFPLRHLACGRFLVVFVVIMVLVVLVVWTLSMMMMTGGIIVAAAAVALAEGDHHPAVLRTKDYEDEVQTLRRQYETKIQTLQKLHDLLQQRHEHTTANTPAAASVTNMVRSDVEYNTAKYDELVQRTYRVRTHVQDYNYNALQTKQQQERGGGLALRLSDILHQEMTRRDRYHATITNTNSTSNVGKKNNANNRYVTQAELTTLLLPSSSLSYLFANMNSSSATNMTAADALATQVIETYTQKEDTTLQSRLQYITTKYPYEYNTTLTMYKNALAEEKKKKKKTTTKCISTSKGIQLAILLDRASHLRGEG